MRTTREGNSRRQFRFSAMTALACFCLYTGMVPAWAQTRAAAKSPQSEGAEVMAAEIEFQRDENTFNVTALKRLMASDGIEVQDEIMNRDRVLEVLSSFRGFPCHLSPVKMEDTDVALLAKGVATILYKATETLSCGRKSLTIQGNASGVWVRKDGHWQAQIHTETIDWSKMEIHR